MLLDARASRYKCPHATGWKHSASRRFSDSQISTCLKADHTTLFPENILEMGIYHFQLQAAGSL